MKKNNVYHFLFAWLCIAATSCSKDKVDASKENGQVLTSQIEKIETVLAKGATKQNVIIDNVPKIETRASDAVRKLRAQMRQEVDQSYQKTRVMSNSPATHPRAFAVFKEGSCFGYPRVFIKMDCEDHRAKTSSKGWTGDSHVDHGDMYLDFCIINDNYANYMGVNDFGPTSPVVNAAYGFLYLGETIYWRTDPGANSGYPAGWRNYWFPWPVAVRIFDNEDGGADNQVWQGDHEVTDLTYWLSSGTGSDRSYVDASNTRLHWIIAPGGASTSYASRTIPGMGQYGLLGKFGPTQGELYTDDEDSGNDNVFEVGGFYNRTSSSSGAGHTSTFPWSYTIEGTDNTWIHLSRVF